MSRAKIIFVFAFVLAGMLAPASAQPGEPNANGNSTMSFDVAIDVKTFNLNNNNPADPKNPIRGSTFIVYGKIFPAGTIPSGVTSFDPNQPGSIGTWVCRGVFLADYADVVSGAAKLLFHTSQLFMFPSDDSMLVTEGLEGNVGVSTHRIVIGGTGSFAGAKGQQLQENIGVNQNGPGLFDLRFTFQIHVGGAN